MADFTHSLAAWVNTLRGREVRVLLAIVFAAILVLPFAWLVIRSAMQRGVVLATGRCRAGGPIARRPAVRWRAAKGRSKSLGPRPSRDRKRSDFFVAGNSLFLIWGNSPKRAASSPRLAAATAPAGHFRPLCAPLVIEQ
jgi:hypothetical protein